jgi:hypothetical protein
MRGRFVNPDDLCRVIVDPNKRLMTLATLETTFNLVSSERRERATYSGDGRRLCKK